jgi:hypothetical protein
MGLVHTLKTTLLFSPAANLSAILALFDPVPDPKLQ